MKHTLTAALCVAALTLAGCTNTPDPPAPDPTTSTVPTPTQAGPVEPTMPPEASRQTKAGAIAFAKYYWHVANYAVATLDTTELVRLHARTCGQCVGAIKWIRDVRAAGGRIVGGMTHISRIDATGINARSHRWLVELTTEEDPARVVRAGHLDRKYKAGQATDLMIMQFGATGWRVASWQSR